ncbi:MAG TPA: hypothetical protein VMF64_13735 [Steroidobacteraceae bacterium]|nr:hypothetical protein [Steroidobacteraceae bacterium]
MSNAIQFETANFRWAVNLERQAHHTTATVRGSPHVVGPAAVGQSVEPGRHPEFTVDGANQDDLFEQIRTTIVGLDGPITKGDAAGDSED